MTSDVVRWTRNDDKEKSKHCYFVNAKQCRDRSYISDLSDRYDTSLINLRLLRDRQHKQRDQQQPKVRDQQQRQQQQILSFNEILVIMSRFCSYGRSSSTRSSSDGAIIAASTMTPRYRRSLFLKFFTFIFVILQVNVFCSSFFVIVAAATDSSSNSSSGRNDGGNSANGHFTPTWAVHIPNGDENGKADRVARDHGFMNLGKIFDDHYHFHHRSLAKRSLTGSHPHQQRLEDDHRVHWSKQQRVKSRQKRDFIRMRPSRTSSQTMSLVSRVQLNDPKWPQMWYLNRGNGLDMNVIPAWEQGITGKGVVVTILDDGLESDHPDLEHNYDPKASYDVNSHDDDPMPHYDMTDSNRHGTRCAGEVAATANNSLCAVGIAFGASVGGVRMLDGDVTDAVEARSLSLNPQHIDIYSASWGPDDDGKTVDGPGELATRAFIEGVTKGRDGKGSIFIWASGNGGRELDNCNCDGYTNSIWTLSISSATEEGLVPWYSEKCSSTLATTYSSGAQNEKQVVTTDLHHSCTTSHTGTSASAPLAAGIVALVLEANRNLTWRDLQHIVVRTAKPGNLKDPTWSKNGVGRRISHSFGYGLMDASAMVKVARTWQMVPEQQRCEINAPHVDQAIPPKRYITLQLTVNHCNGVNFLEHVQAKISLTSQRRGDIQIFLQSPSGTRVTLLTSRLHDISRSGFNQWPFMSVHTWGESPRGNWLLEIHNEGRFMAQVTQWDLIFFGTDLPAQPDDPVQNAPGRFGQYGGDLENNFLGPDPETMSGQWRDNQQIGESHVDVQRTTSNDETSTACRNFAADQRCIECDPTTFLYNGRCWSLCPEQSYMIPEVPYNAANGKLQQLLSLRSVINSSLSLSSGTWTKRAVRNGAFQKKCAACHTTCLKCRGSDPRDCLQCLPGHELTIISSDESYCYAAPSGAKFPGNNLSRATGEQGDPMVRTVFQKLDSYRSVIVVTITGLVLVVVAAIVAKDYLSRRRKLNDYTYDRVALNATNEETQSLKEANDADETEAIRLDYERRKRDIAGTSKTTDRRISVESSSSESDLY